MINKDDFLLSVVIPVYNEAGTIREIHVNAGMQVEPQELLIELEL